MKKYLVLGLLLLVPFFAKANTTVYGFLNGNFYNVNGDLKYACLQDGNCFDYTSQSMTTLNQILGLSTTTPQTITITTGTSTPVTQVPIVSQQTNIATGGSEPVVSPIVEQSSCNLVMSFGDPKIIIWDPTPEQIASLNQYTAVAHWTSVGESTSSTATLYGILGENNFVNGSNQPQVVGHLVGDSGTQPYIYNQYKNYKMVFTDGLNCLATLTK